MTMLMKDFDTSAPVLSDEEIEAQVFRDLEAAQKSITRQRRRKCHPLSISGQSDRTSALARVVAYATAAA
ncbi:hypothetical protein [Leisingera aquimarina]|uniref:hypothetical protein n=1 Tax=Leisingera aquimarina TaxID=476529 RepID=UPI00048542FB|nr:hypothetical protein [Leisingera aquimarina]